MDASRARRTRHLVIAIVAVVAAIRVAALPLRGTEDVLTWKIWTIGASKNVATVYGVGGQPPVRGELHWMQHSTTVDYLPVALTSSAPRGWSIGRSTPTSLIVPPSPRR